MSLKKIIKGALIILVCGVLFLISVGIWLMSLIPEDLSGDFSQMLPTDLPYLTGGSLKPERGKILAVVTSCDKMGSSLKSTGYELTELSRAYYVFQANGFEVDIASPKGGQPPVVIDWEDMGPYDYAFLNDSVAQYKVNHSIPVQEVEAVDYQAIYFVGGKGAMFDFPQNSHLQSIIRQCHDSGKVIGAVCHGPAALLNVTLNDGSPLIVDKVVTGFTNAEELFLTPDAKHIFPFLLQSRMIDQGALFKAGSMYLENVRLDGHLITGQNPWSTWAVAESMIRQMGYEPVARVKTAEENTIEVLSAYEVLGYDHAEMKVNQIYVEAQNNTDRLLLAKHVVIAAMQWDMGKLADLIRLLHLAKSLSAH